MSGVRAILLNFLVEELLAAITDVITAARAYQLRVAANDFHLDPNTYLNHVQDLANAVGNAVDAQREVLRRILNYNDAVFAPTAPRQHGQGSRGDRDREVEEAFALVLGARGLLANGAAAVSPPAGVLAQALRHQDYILAPRLYAAAVRAGLYPAP